MGLGGWISRLFKRSSTKPAADGAAPAKHSRAVPTGIKRPLVRPGSAAPLKPDEHVAGELHTKAELVGKDAEFLVFQCFCGKKMKAPLAQAGKRTKCPVCARVLDIPSA